MNLGVWGGEIHKINKKFIKDFGGIWRVLGAWQGVQTPRGGQTLHVEDYIPRGGDFMNFFYYFAVLNL